MPSTNRILTSVAITGLCSAIFGCSGEPMGEAEDLGKTTLAVSANDPYVFATFDGDAASEQHLFIFTSPDASNWTQLADTGFTGPTGVLRDPSIIKNPGDGKWYIAYTVYSWNQNSTYFNIASSTDLYTWTHVTSVNAGVAGTSYTWAPEFYIEAGTVYAIVSLSPSNSPWAFRSYYYTALNNSLSSWSGPTAMSGLGPNKIDTSVIKRQGVYHAFTQNGDTLYQEHATASSLAGPWTYVQTGNWAGWGSGKEGPDIFQKSDGSYAIFSDWYPSNGIYQATSSDLTNWSAQSSVSSLSSKRHGTVWRNASSSGGLSGMYRIQPSYVTSQCLEPSGGSGQNALIQTWSCGQSWNPNWNVVQVSPNVYELRAANSGLCLVTQNAAFGNGNNLVLWPCQSQVGSRWNITASGSNYKFNSIDNTSKCIDVNAWGTSNGTKVQVWDCTSGTNQMFGLASF